MGFINNMFLSSGNRNMDVRLRAVDVWSFGTFILNLVDIDGLTYKYKQTKK